MPKTLTPKQARFVEEYLVDLNGTQAAIRAGYSKRTAHVIATQLINKTLVAEAISAAKAARSDETGIDAAYVLRQAVKLHERCMQEIIPFTDKKGNQITDGEGHPLFVFNALGAKGGLELVGRHISVRAFPESKGGKVTVDTQDEQGKSRITIEFVNNDTDSESL